MNETGAASALARVSEWEARAADRFEASERALTLALENAKNKPPETDGEDYEKAISQAKRQRDDAFEAWNELAATLHKFDRSVSPEKRDASEKLSRSECEQLFRRLGVYLSAGMEMLITQCCQEFLVCKKPEELYIIGADKFRACLTSSIADAIRETHLPEWVAVAFSEVLILHLRENAG